MERLVQKYARKLVQADLAEEGEPLFAGLDDEMVCNRKPDPEDLLAQVFHGLNINSLLICRPKEPYRSILDYLVATAKTATIYPQDTETRTFLHDIPIVSEYSAPALVAALGRRKGVIAPGGRVVTFGSVSPEQAFVFFSSVCFAVFVKFMSDRLAFKRQGRPDAKALRLLKRLRPHLDRFSATVVPLAQGPFSSEEEIHQAMDQAGCLVVDRKLVDSFFGNISYCDGHRLHISQTSSSLDALPGCIDVCPLDGSSSTAITASSELGAHLQTMEQTGLRAIVHGHPKFSVVISMDCDKSRCDLTGRCHIDCPEKRSFGQIPIVSGEVGAGPTGLVNTLPKALVGHSSAIVYGHGLFCLGRVDFNDAIENMSAIESACQQACFERLGLDPPCVFSL
jgi:ribulose-5-phosphate 4-epimerase/fuculose-1-phosphate aldolase